jgi:dipeptidyl aminopeptidase/acylaminoacyl peptidase
MLIAYRTAALAIVALATLCISNGLQAQEKADKEKADKPKERIVQPGENLVVEGLPTIPYSLVDDVRRYTEARSAAFYSWHPTQRMMLIGTRFGNSTQVHLVKRPGGARTQLTFFDEPVAAASFHPKNGFSFIFSKDVGGNEFSQLYRFDRGTSKSTLLTDGQRSQNGAAVWNHANDRFAYASTSRNGADRDIWIMDPAKPKSNKILVELAGGGWRPLDWSGDDSKLLVLEYLSVNKSNLYIVDVATGKKEAITPADQPVAYGSAKFSTQPDVLWVTADRDSEFQRLGRWDIKQQRFTPITADINWNVESFELSPDGSQLAFTTNEAGVSKLYLVDTSNDKRQAIHDLPQGVFALGDWHKNGKEIAVSVSSAQSTSDVYSVDVSTMTVARWTESELGGLVAKDLAEPELMRWKSFDGLEISGFLYLPPPKFVGKRPVIINIHGGPEGQSRPTFLGRNNYFINELGAAMIYPNIRGSDGYGKTYLQLDNGLKRLDSVKDIGALLDAIKDDSRLDANRVMVTGGSYGGYMTLACAVEYNDRLACALDVVGISHFGTFLKNTESYRRDLRRVEYGDERVTEIAEFFEKTAPLNQAGKITKPLFVVQGGNDPRVPLSEAEQMVHKVKAGGGPIWYLMARDEGHGFRKKNNADYQFYATIMFVKQHLIKE